MTHQVTVSGSGIVFPCEAGESILDASERAGYAIPYSCRKGVCSSCEGGLIAGAVDLGRGGHASGPRSGVLFCRARPQADVEIAPKRIVRREPPARRTVAARVYSIRRASPGVTILQLRFPIGVKVRFRAGQYLQVVLPDGERRNYSMANAPQQSDVVQIHVRHLPGGRFSSGVVPRLGLGDRVTVELPFGEFSLREAGDKPVILVATGTGFSPIHSMIEDLIRRGTMRPLALYWGARQEEELYLRSAVERWVGRAPALVVRPVLSQASEGWEGKRGRVQEAVLADHPDLAGHEVYACGSPAMVEDARIAFSAAGLAMADFFSDAFVPSTAPDLTEPLGASATA